MNFVEKAISWFLLGLAGFFLCSLSFSLVDLGESLVEINKERIAIIEDKLSGVENTPWLYEDYPEGFCDFFVGDWMIYGEIFTIDPETCSGRTSSFAIKIDPNPNMPWYSSPATFCGDFGCISHPIRVEDGKMFDIFYGYFEAERIN